MILCVAASANNADTYFCVLQYEYYARRAAFKQGSSLLQRIIKGYSILSIWEGCISEVGSSW